MTQTEHGASQEHSDHHFPALLGLGVSSSELEVLRRSGYLERDRRRGQGYWRLRFRHLGRQRSVYIGTDRLLADQVQYELDLLQDQHRRDQELARAERQVTKKLRVLKSRLARQLGRLGFHYHGDQLRKRRVRAAPESAT